MRLGPAGEQCHPRHNSPQASSGRDVSTGGLVLVLLVLLTTEARLGRNMSTGVSACRIIGN